MSNSAATWIRRVFFGAIVLLSASTSFLYFVEVFSFGRGLVEDSLISVMVNGAIGVLVLDIAALAWLRIYLQAADNNELRFFALTGAGVGVVGSALSSLAYLLMVSSGYAVPERLAVYTQWAMAAVIVIHFLLVFLSSYRATSAKIDEKTAAMLSEATDEMLLQTEQEFRRLIPGLARQNAEQLTQELAARFSGLSTYQELQQSLPAPQTASQVDRETERQNNRTEPTVNGHRAGERFLR